MNKKYSDYIKIGKKKFFLDEYGFNVRILLDIKEYYLKNKKKHIYLIKEDALFPIRLNLKKLDEMIEETDRHLSARDFFK
jgi:hypothetical protein